MNKSFLIFFIAASLLTCGCRATQSTHHPHREITIVHSDSGAQKVSLVEEGTTYPLASLPSQAIIRETSISPSGQHAYVHYATPWPDQPERPFFHFGLTLNLDERREIDRIGFPWSASVEWTVVDDLWYWESRGTGVGQVTIQKNDGTLIDQFMVSGVALSPDGRFQVIYPNYFLAEPVVITDMSTYEIIYEGYLSGDEDTRYIAGRPQWSIDHIQFRYSLEFVRDAEEFEAIIPLP